jgi:hypothetical protein
VVVEPVAQIMANKKSYGIIDSKLAISSFDIFLISDSIYYEK